MSSDETTDIVGAVWDTPFLHMYDRPLGFIGPEQPGDKARRIHAMNGFLLTKLKQMAESPEVRVPWWVLISVLVTLSMLVWVIMT